MKNELRTHTGEGERNFAKKMSSSSKVTDVCPSREAIKAKHLSEINLPLQQPITPSADQTPSSVAENPARENITNNLEENTSKPEPEALNPAEKEDGRLKALKFQIEVCSVLFTSHRI